MEFIKQKIKVSQVLYLLLANFFSVFAWGMFAPIFALVVVDRGGSASQVGIAWGGYTLLTGALMLIFGRIEDSYHMTKRLLVIGATALVVASLVLLSFKTQSGLIGSIVIFGFGFGMSMPALKAIYGKLVDRGKEATEWAAMDGGNMLVMSGAAVIGGYLYQYASADVLYIAMTSVFLLSALLYSLVISSFKNNF